MNYMPNNELKALRISRLLTQEHRSDLLSWVRLAFVAENSARKAVGVFNQKPQEFSCSNNARRSKE